MRMAMAEAPWRQRFRAAQLSFPEWARDAPDRLVYTSNAGGKWEVYAWDVRAHAHRQVTDREEGTATGAIDPLGRSIWWFDDARGNEFGRWLAEPFEPDGLGPRPTAPELPPAYSAGLALAREFAVIGSSGEGGTAVHLVRAPAPPRLLYAHREAATVAGLSRDETLLCLSHAEHGDTLHRALRVLDLEGRTVADLWDGPGLGLQAVAWSPVRGDQRLLVVHERHGPRRPLIWDVRTGTADEVPVDLPGDVTAAWYPDAAALLIVHHHRGRGELYRLRLADGVLSRLESETGDISAAAVRPDGEVWYAWSRSSTPPEVRAVDPARGWRTVLRPPGEQAPAGVAYAWHEANGVPIFLAEPPGGRRPYPTVFWIHGGPTAHDRDAFSPRVQAWVDHGYAVVLVNYRGSTGHGRAWRDAIIGNPGFTELEDIVRVHDWVLAEGIADPARVVLAGGSWGGYLTLLGLGLQPERWALGIAAVPVADFVAAYEDEMEPLKAYDRSLFGGPPEALPERYRERSPITYVERVRVPVLILAGENDPRCPIRQIDSYIARLTALGKPHEVYRFTAGHGSLVVDETIRQMEVMLAFAARHLGTPLPM
jgi:acetyl esterase/lipase